MDQQALPHATEAHQADASFLWGTEGSESPHRRKGDTKQVSHEGLGVTMVPLGKFFIAII